MALRPVHYHAPCYALTRYPGHTPAFGRGGCLQGKICAKTKKRQTCASDSGVLPDPDSALRREFGRTKQKGNGIDRPKPIRRRLPGHDEQPQDKDLNLITPKRKELSTSGGDVKVNWPRPRLEIRPRYVGSPEETRWRCEFQGTKKLVGLPSKS